MENSEFSIPDSKDKERKVDRGRGFTCIRGIWDECQDLNNSAQDSNDDGEMDHGGETSTMSLQMMTSYIKSLKLKSPLVNNIFLMTKRKCGILMQLVIKRKKKHQNFATRTWIINFVQWMWDSILSSFVMFIYQILLYIQFVSGQLLKVYMSTKVTGRQKIREK